jgi:fumarate reductase flavoprotein subunit
MSDWDIECDVVVLGAGPAGMAAVASALAEGASVVAVEARDHIGGNAVWSTGYLTFVDSAMQHDLGITHDDEQHFVDDARHIFDLAAEQYGIVFDEELIRLFARESAETYRILTERGVRFSRFIPRPKQHTIDRMAATVDTWAYQRAFQTDFDAATTLFGTSARRLVTENAAVTGVVVGSAAGHAPDRRIRARGGVVLATGGYQANPELRLRYQPGFLAGGPYLGVETARGDGHLLGQAVGGDLVNMTYVPPLVITSSSLVEDAIAVNVEGVRFHDEAGPYENRVADLLRQPERRAHYVFDSVVASEKATLVAQMPTAPIVADTLVELAHRIGVPADALLETVRSWNEIVRSQAPDTRFGRVVFPPGNRRIETPPFTAVEMVVGVNFSSGGFRTTPQMQVIDVFGDPIPGLYAAGDCAGALGPIADLGGTRISGGFTFGRLAGRAAATGQSGQRRGPGVFGAYLPDQLGTDIALVDLRTEASATTSRVGSP